MNRKGNLKIFKIHIIFDYKKGKPIARILPLEGDKGKAARSVETLNIRKKYKMSHKEIKDLIREGRRY